MPLGNKGLRMPTQTWRELHGSSAFRLALEKHFYFFMQPSFQRSCNSDRRATVSEVEFKTDYIENTRKPNERIDNFTPYQKFVDAWTVEAKKELPVPIAAA
jgi:hypothetical protein